MNKTESWFFEITYRNRQPLSKVIKKKEKTSQTENRNKKRLEIDRMEM